MIHYTVQSPVLLLAFNRPDTASRVFTMVKTVKPSRLYIAVDGPRNGNKKDEILCEQTRRIYDNVDWECEVHRLFRDENKGCKIAVADAVSWFFDNEEKGIILEDDCLPCMDFFYFCDEMLERYRHDTRIMNITGTNLQMGKRWGNADYYFSQYSHIWGWASWRRAWKLYDVELKRYSLEDAGVLLSNIFSDPFLVEGWVDIFKRLKAGKIDSWDYQFNFVTFFENGLCVTPNVNLIMNLGFREDATHTFEGHTFHANLPTGTLSKPVQHPVYFVPEKQADYFFLKKDFHLEQRWEKVRKDNQPRRRFKRWLKHFFKKR
ncbi:MAG: hypothetical protein KF862_11030 [Chitinophagaceae bacterium]|nr:hypothetical protein [Chitinophagaceae bacterium]